MNSVEKGIVLLVAVCVAVASANCSTTPIIRTVYHGGKHFEEPHWSTPENALYWVDTDTQIVYRMDGQSGNITTREIGYGPVSLVVTVKDNPGLLVVSVRTQLFLLRWGAPGGDAALRLLSAVDVGLPDNRVNDGKVDAKGRLWFGTMIEVKGIKDQKKDQGTLYVIDQHNYANPEIKVRPVSVSNGIAWTADKKSMFHIDTPTKNVDVFDFNLETGEIGNRRHLFNLEANNITGIPDGMTIDKDDNLWVACYGAGMIVKVNSRTGDLLEKHYMPASEVTSPMWGGPGLSTLYVTSSRRDLSPKQLAKEHNAGSLFAVEGTGTSGLPENQFVFPGAGSY